MNESKSIAEGEDVFLEDSDADPIHGLPPGLKAQVLVLRRQSDSLYLDHKFLDEELMTILSAAIQHVPVVIEELTFKIKPFVGDPTSEMPWRHCCKAVPV